MREASGRRRGRSRRGCGDSGESGEEGVAEMGKMQVHGKKGQGRGEGIHMERIRRVRKWGWPGIGCCGRCLLGGGSGWNREWRKGEELAGEARDFAGGEAGMAGKRGSSRGVAGR